MPVGLAMHHVDHPWRLGDPAEPLDQLRSVGVDRELGIHNYLGVHGDVAAVDVFTWRTPSARARPRVPTAW